MGPIGCPETWVTKYHSTLRKILKKKADLRGEVIYVFQHHAMKTSRVLEVQLHELLTLTLDGEVSHHPDIPLATTKKEFSMPTGAGRDRSRSGSSGDEKNPFALTGIENRFLSRPSRCLLSIPTAPPHKYVLYFLHTPLRSDR
jgi:hypothetical protein